MSMTYLSLGADVHDLPEPGTDVHDLPEPGTDLHDLPELGADIHDLGQFVAASVVYQLQRLHTGLPYIISHIFHS